MKREKNLAYCWPNKQDTLTDFASVKRNFIMHHSVKFDKSYLLFKGE